MTGRAASSPASASAARCGGSRRIRSPSSPRSSCITPGWWLRNCSSPSRMTGYDLIFDGTAAARRELRTEQARQYGRNQCTCGADSSQGCLLATPLHRDRPCARRRTTKRWPITARPRSTGSRRRASRSPSASTSIRSAESLLPLIPEFRKLTGINVEYLILPEAEYFTKLVADLSQQRGEFSVIMTGPMRNWQYVPPNWIVSLDGFLSNPKLTDPGWYKLDDFYPALIAANRWNGKTGYWRRRGLALLDPRAGRELHPRLPQGHLRSVQHQGADDLGGDGRSGPAGEEGYRPSRHRGARHAQPSPAWAPASSVGSSPTPTASGASSTASSNGSPPRSALGEIHRDLGRHGPRERPAELGQHAMVRCDGGLHGRPGGHDRGRRLLRRQLRGPQEVEGRGQGRLCTPAGRTGRQDLFGPVDLGAGHQQRDQEQGRRLAVRAVGDRAAHPAQRHGQLSETTIPRACRSPTTRACRRSWASWGGGSYLKTVAKNLETAKVAWVPQSERQRVGDIWARALHEIYFQRMSAADALKKASNEVDRVLKEAGIK